MTIFEHGDGTPTPLQEFFTTWKKKEIHFVWFFSWKVSNFTLFKNIFNFYSKFYEREIRLIYDFFVKS